MSLYSGSVFSRLSKRSAIRDKSQLAVHLSNDNAMRRLLRDGVGINDVQKKYLSLCYSARPAVRPNRDVAQGLGAGELVWNLTVCEKTETVIIASLLTTKEARSELRSVVISADETGSSSVRKRAGMAKAARRGLGSRGGSREMAMERDPVGQVELFAALCKALPQLHALRSLELQGLRKAFEKSGAGAARLARGLAGNSKLKSLAVRRVCLSDARALGVLSSAIGRHPSLVALSLGQCGLTGKSSGNLVSSVVRAHAARRDALVWSSGLRRPAGVVGHTAVAAPARISTAGCLALDLSGNRLRDAGVHAVARALQSDTWLLGLNLADNEISDRGAALLSVCLQHNATLCALVLDGNTEISREAEKRITEELETRSMMPEAVLEEPEVVVALASWGFSAHAGFEGDLPLPLPPPPPPPPAAADNDDSAVSDISHDSSGGGGGGGPRVTYSRRGGAINAAVVNNVPGLPQTPAERKEEMVREFRRWAGYAPHSSMQDPAHHPASAAPAAAGAALAATRATRAPNAHSDAVEAMTRRPRGRGRPTTSVLLRGDTLGTVVQTDGEEGNDDGSRGRGRGRARARSLSSRSVAARAAGCSEIHYYNSNAGGGGRLAKRNKSSGPFGRATRETPGPGEGARAGVAKTGTGGTRIVQQKAPWGGGTGESHARDRAQAWAKAHLATSGGGAGRSRSSAGTGSRRSRVRKATKGHVGASGCCGGGGGGYKKAGRRAAKGIGSGSGRRTAAGKRRASRHDSKMNPPRRCGGDERQMSRGAAPPRPPLSALDVTWDVLDAQGYPELAPRHRERLFPSATAAVVPALPPAVTAEQSAVSSSPNGDRGGAAARGGGRTDRVVEMMASLEQAVMDVCKDMWRLEDKVEGSERYTPSGGSERTREKLFGLDGVSARDDDDDHDHDHDHEEDEKDNSDGDNGDLEAAGRDDVAAQVEACLRDMWREVHGGNTAAAAAAAAAATIDDPGSNTISGSSAGIMAAADLATHSSEHEEGAEEDEHEQDLVTTAAVHPALISTGGRGGSDCNSSSRRRRQEIPRSGDGTEDHTNASQRASDPLEWRENEEEGEGEGRMGASAGAGHLLRLQQQQQQPIDDSGEEEEAEETLVYTVDRGGEKEADGDNHVPVGGAGGLEAENPAPAGVGGEGLWRASAAFDDEEAVADGDGGGGRVKEEGVTLYEEELELEEGGETRRSRGGSQGGRQANHSPPLLDTTAVSCL